MFCFVFWSHFTSLITKKIKNKKRHCWRISAIGLCESTNHALTTTPLFDIPLRRLWQSSTQVHSWHPQGCKFSESHKGALKGVTWVICENFGTKLKHTVNTINVYFEIVITLWLLILHCCAQLSTTIHCCMRMSGSGSCAGTLRRYQLDTRRCQLSLSSTYLNEHITHSEKNFYLTVTF